jgi:hypothetical protein
MSTYSFQQVTASLVGIGGNINIGQGSGSAAEGITIEPVGDKNSMTIGADGSVSHSLSASSAQTVTVRLLKTSPDNALLQDMFNFQTESALTHGFNVITLRDIARGDFLTLTEVAFANESSLTYATEAGINEWVFNAGKSARILGTGTPEA